MFLVYLTLRMCFIISYKLYTKMATKQPFINDSNIPSNSYFLFIAAKMFIKQNMGTTIKTDIRKNRKNRKDILKINNLLFFLINSNIKIPSVNIYKHFFVSKII